MSGDGPTRDDDALMRRRREKVHVLPCIALLPGGLVPHPTRVGPSCAVSAIVDELNYDSVPITVLTAMYALTLAWESY